MAGWSKISENSHRVVFELAKHELHHPGTTGRPGPLIATRRALPPRHHAGADQILRWVRVLGRYGTSMSVPAATADIPRFRDVLGATRPGQIGVERQS